MTVGGLLCVFCIVSQISDFVKNFFRSRWKWYKFDTVPLKLSRPILDALPVVTGKPLLDCMDIIPYLPGFVKHYFCLRWKWLLTFTRWKGLFFAPLLQSALCAPVSARSACVHLVAMTVGVMALFHLPGLSPVDFYRQSRVMVCGCVGAFLPDGR